MKLKFFILYILLFPFSFLAAKSAPSHYVLVSVAPYQFFVEKIAGDILTVGLMVPAGASAHTFEPTPRQMLTASQADLWFCLGESFEERAVRALKAHRPEMGIIDLRQGVEMITTDPLSCCACHANCQDLHIWLSVRQSKIQAQHIAQVLAQYYPEHAATFKMGLEKFLAELTALDESIEKLLKPLKNRLILVSHPAYAYFCRDYDLSQFSIEVEGKDPTPRQLHNILSKARTAHITKIYTQPQYSSKGARLFAKELNAQIVSLDPYAKEYIQSMHEIARAFADN